MAKLRRALVASGTLIHGQSREATFDREHHSGITWSLDGSLIAIEPTHLNMSQDRHDISQTVGPNGDARAADLIALIVESRPGECWGVGRIYFSVTFPNPGFLQRAHALLLVNPRTVAK